MLVEELALLRSKVSVGALHNSGERHDAPRCHPGTRVGIQDDIMKWLDDVDDPQLVLWMHGSEGVGKTVLAHAIASLCYDLTPRRLAGAFFLSHTAAAQSGRGDEKRLVPTLAYQMTMNIPYLERHIAIAIARNRLIFELDLETQIKELIIGPLTDLSDETSNKIHPMIFVFDALDECLSTTGQVHIVQAFVTAMKQMQHKIPHKLLITSRPEFSVKSIFAADEISPLVRSVSLDDEYGAQEDIRKFSVDSFARLRKTHPSPGTFPPIWPEDDDIEILVWRSSGLFIHASAMLNYIQEDCDHLVPRLQTIVELAFHDFCSDFQSNDDPHDVTLDDVFEGKQQVLCYRDETYVFLGRLAHKYIHRTSNFHHSQII
ncbi:hypothetical protein BJ912DRAFT_965138 [Pholiota molesta]|nr:hypothetical protein BJ912DRAFT_965138 [Pholiota molesta]